MKIQDAERLVMFSLSKHLPAMYRWSCDAGVDEHCEVIGVSNMSALLEAVCPYCVIVTDAQSEHLLQSRMGNLIRELSISVYEFVAEQASLTQVVRSTKRGQIAWEPEAASLLL